MKSNISILPRLVLQNPDIALHMSQAFLGVQKAQKIDYNRRSGKSSEMPLITFKITSLCNLHCIMCGQRGKTGTLKGEKAIEEAKTLVSIERYKELTDEVAKKTRVFYMWGGEPFMYPNFMDLAAYMAKKIPVFTVNTNGTHLAENAKRIVEDQWSGFFISLDSYNEVNDKIRGHGSFNKVIEGIKAINREKDRQHSVLPHMGIVTTISNMNYLFLDKLVEATQDINLSWHIINLGTYMNDHIGACQREVFMDLFGIEPYFWQGFNNGMNEGIDGKKFASILKIVHAMKSDHPVITVPVINPKKIGVFHSELETPVRDKCTAPWFSVNINYNGDVHFCADYPDYVIGNIKEEKLWDIYNNEKAIKFRKGLKAQPDGLFPACKRCYQLMLCGHRKKGY
ncbi:MAG: radical SAM protein [Spirochaetaceae bacterium]|nr:MAG: radical SAM protein [Spirochaetaceae bacterium]